MKKYLVLFSCFLLLACNKDDEGIPGFVYGLPPDFKVYNKEKQNLLNAETEGFYVHNQIRVSHLRNDGEYVIFDNPNLDARFDYLLFEEKGDYSFRLLNQVNNSFIINDQITSVIKWNNSVSDTAVCLMNRERYSFTVSKVWVNGTLEYDIKLGTDNKEKIVIQR